VIFGRAAAQWRQGLGQFCCRCGVCGRFRRRSDRCHPFAQARRLTALRRLAGALTAVAARWRVCGSGCFTFLKGLFTIVCLIQLLDFKFLGTGHDTNKIPHSKALILTRRTSMTSVLNTVTQLEDVERQVQLLAAEGRLVRLGARYMTTASEPCNGSGGRLMRVHCHQRLVVEIGEG